MPRPFLSLCPVILACTLTAFATEDWPDADGTRFQGEPAAVLGSLALFRTEATTLKRVPLRALPPDDCRRFYRAIADRSVPSVRWTEARGHATRSLIDGLQRVEFQYRKLVPADLSVLPEPELLIVLFGYQGYSGSWFMVHNFIPTFYRVQNACPGLAATVFFGTAPSMGEHNNMAESSWMPWLITQYNRQGGMHTIGRHATNGGTWMTVMTRDGDLLLASQPTDLPTVRRFIDDLTELLWTASPLNSRAWADRVHYGRAVRPLAFAGNDTGPELVGNPLRVEGLRQRGVGRIEARLEIDAEGKVIAATLQPGSAVPEKMAGPLADALRRSAVFLPAMAGGQTVASTYHYVMEVPPANPQVEADAAWLDRSLRGEVPLQDWLLLTAIPVPQKDFDEIESVGPDGKVIMRAFEVSNNRVSRAAQMSAFHSDFFAESGAANVRPVEGQSQAVDSHTLTWRAVKSMDGYVNLETGHYPRPEYCVGYAWTEIEVSADIPAWLGIGSDDGLKIWLNGELVKDHWVRRISRLDDDIVPLKLKAGKNQLLFKVQNITRDWSFVARLRFRER